MTTQGYLYGMELLESEALVIEHKEIKRKHRQKRLQKKFIKKYGYNYSSVPDSRVFIFQNQMIGHPETLKAILKKAQSGGG